MKVSFRCVSCDSLFVLDHNTFNSVDASYGEYRGYNRVDHGEELTVGFLKCPGCNYMHIELIGKGDLIKDKHFNIHPISNARVFPDYIPETLRRDYEEAYSVLQFSPRASAVLARRSLQGIIRNKFPGFAKSNRLADEIKAI